MCLDRRGCSEDHGDYHQREHPDRDVDVEDPAPGEVVDEEPAEERSDHRRDAEDRSEEALVAAAVARRDDVADDREGHHEETAAAEPLQRAERDQLRHVLADPAQRRANQEDHDRALQDELAAEEVAELPVDRPDHRRSQQVGRDDPRELRDAAEVADDRRQRRGDDRLVERREQQHEQQRAEDQANALRGLVVH
jgi:hypothetical protein